MIVRATTAGWLLLAAGGCIVVPDPDYPESGESSGREATSGDDVGSTGGDPSADASSGAPVLDCAVSDLEGPKGACPEGCDRCKGDACRFECLEDRGCKDEIFDCPPGFACEVACLEHEACRNAVVVCPADGACAVECEGDNACAGLTVVCAGGPCDLACGPTASSCEDATMRCGARSSVVTCETAVEGELVVEQDAASGCECAAANGCDRDGGGEGGG